MNFTVPIECSEGHQYLLKFTDCKSLPIELDVEVVDIALSLASEIAIIKNNTGTLIKIASVIFNFLDDNDVILYFYCSKDDIIQRKTRKPMLPQQYRSQLFSTMFDKITKNCEPGAFINKPVILRDEAEGDHYLHFIAKSKYADKMDEFSKHMENIFGK